MFIVAVIIVILRAGGRMLGEIQSLKVSRGRGFCVFRAHSGILLEVKMAGAQLVWHVKRVSARVAKQSVSELQPLGW
jgi:hypothetical protein